MARLRFTALLLASACTACTLAEAEAGGPLSFDLRGRTAEEGQMIRIGLDLYGLAQGFRRGAAIRQRGSRKSAQIRETGLGNGATIVQRGSGHHAVINQTGSDDRYGIFQFGRGTSAAVSQSGDGLSGATFQFGW